MGNVKRSSESFKFFEKNYWNYYREIENEFLATRRYVDFSELNNHTFSVEYLKLYQAVCSEIDVIGKAMASIVNRDFDAEDKENNILKWWLEVQDSFFVTEGPFTWLNQSNVPKRYSLQDYKCCLLNEIVLVPWQSFRTEQYKDKKGATRHRCVLGCKTPSWWSDYNKVKHNRTLPSSTQNNYAKANFKNLSNAYAALYTLERAYMDTVGTFDDLQTFMDFSLLFVKKKRMTREETKAYSDSLFGNKNQGFRE